MLTAIPGSRCGRRVSSSTSRSSNRGVSRRGRLAWAGFLWILPAAALAQAAGPPKPTPNQAAMAALVARTCAALAGQPVGAVGLTAAQQDLLQRCSVLTNAATAPTVLAAAYNAILGQQVNALGPLTRQFATLAQDNLTARLAELRRGQQGVSLAGLAVTDADGRDLSAGQSGAAGLLPGGASGDSSGDLLDGKLGIFLNGNLAVGSKGPSPNSFAFDVSGNSLTLGADYRVGERFVVGGAIGSGHTKSDFGDALGRVDLASTGVSVFASYYRERFYLDLLAGVGRPKVDLRRHINYTEMPGTPGAIVIDQRTHGATHSREAWTGLSSGWDFHWKALSVTPELSLNFHQNRLDGFRETVSQPLAPGAGLALAFDPVTVPSLQGRAGIRLAYVFSTPWGVLVPNAHATYIREFRNSADAFAVRYADSAMMGSPAEQPALIHADAPEGHYTANGGGFVAQFAHGISGFADYEQLRSLQTIKKHEFAFGLRYQGSF